MMVEVSIGEGLDATFAKKCAKFRHGSIAATACLGRLSRLYRLRVSAYSFEFRVLSFGAYSIVVNWVGMIGLLSLSGLGFV